VIGVNPNSALSRRPTHSLHRPERRRNMILKTLRTKKSHSERRDMAVSGPCCKADTCICINNILGVSPDLVTTAGWKFLKNARPNARMGSRRHRGCATATITNAVVKHVCISVTRSRQPIWGGARLQLTRVLRTPVKQSHKSTVSRLG
jgi:hypothetical protein